MFLQCFDRMSRKWIVSLPIGFAFKIDLIISRNNMKRIIFKKIKHEQIVQSETGMFIFNVIKRARHMPR